MALWAMSLELPQRSGEWWEMRSHSGSQRSAPELRSSLPFPLSVPAVRLVVVSVVGLVAPSAVVLPVALPVERPVVAPVALLVVALPVERLAVAPVAPHSGS